MNVKDLVVQIKSEYPNILPKNDFTDAEFLACLVFHCAINSGADLKEITSEAITSAAEKSNNLKEFLAIIGFKLS